MTDLFVGDLHLNDNPRDAYRHDFQPWLLKQVKAIKPRRLVFVGDFTDAKDQHRSWLVNKIAGYFDRLSAECDVVALMGNHDYLDPQHPFFEFLSRIPGVTWIMRPQAVDGWLYLPHTRDYQQDWRGIDLAKHPLIITHNTFTGADNGFGKKLRGIPFETIPKGVKVIAGDVHYPQNDGPITYIGAPYLVNFGDEYNPRILRLDGMKFSNIDVPGPRKLVIEMIALEQTKQGFKFDIPKKWDTILEAGDILELRVTITSDHLAHWQEIRRYVRKIMEQEGRFVVHAVKPIHAAARKTSALVRSDRRSDLELTRVYGSKRNLDKETLAVGVHIVEDRNARKAGLHPVRPDRKRISRGKVA